jgi:death-on-curing family protein
MSLDDEKIILLEVEHLLDINNMIRKKSKEKKEIGYSGEKTYSIDMNKIDTLIKKAPSNDIVDTETYYLRKIILLQPFPDGNHRTALTSVELFLNKNGFDLSYTAEEALNFQKNAYNIRLEAFGHYGQHDISILTKQDDNFTKICKEFIEKGLTKHD